MDKGLRLVLTDPVVSYNSRPGCMGLGRDGDDMTKNRRAKKAARERKIETGEPYVVARRLSAGLSRRRQLLEELADLDLDPEEYSEATDDEIAAAIDGELAILFDDDDYYDADESTLDDDSGYGPDSYFARAMNKDD